MGITSSASPPVYLLEKLHALVKEIYADNASVVPYHGWHHVHFVVQKAEMFMGELQADRVLTLAAAYVHDFNYLVAGESDEVSGKSMRNEVLSNAGFDEDFRKEIERIIAEARTSHRNASISPEAKALSDADTAYKALPIAPLMTAHYLAETGRNLYDLARKIVTEQSPLEEAGIYFYSHAAEMRFGAWAKENLAMWRRVLESFDSDDTVSVIADMGESIAA